MTKCFRTMAVVTMLLAAGALLLLVTGCGSEEPPARPAVLHAVANPFGGVVEAAAECDPAGDYTIAVRLTDVGEATGPKAPVSAIGDPALGAPRVEAVATLLGGTGGVDLEHVPGTGVTQVNVTNLAAGSTGDHIAELHLYLPPCGQP